MPSCLVTNRNTSSSNRHGNCTAVDGRRLADGNLHEIRVSMPDRTGHNKWPVCLCPIAPQSSKILCRSLCHLAQTQTQCSHRLLQGACAGGSTNSSLNDSTSTEMASHGSWELLLFGSRGAEGRQEQQRQQAEAALARAIGEVSSTDDFLLPATLGDVPPELQQPMGCRAHEPLLGDRSERSERREKQRRCTPDSESFETGDLRITPDAAPKPGQEVPEPVNPTSRDLKQISFQASLFEFLVGGGSIGALPLAFPHHLVILLEGARVTSGFSQDVDSLDRHSGSEGPPFPGLRRRGRSIRAGNCWGRRPAGRR